MPPVLPRRKTTPFGDTDAFTPSPERPVRVRSRSLPADAAAQAIAEGVRELWPDAECVCLPLADGGEGTLDALVSATLARVAGVAQQVADAGKAGHHQARQAASALYHATTATAMACFALLAACSTTSAFASTGIAAPGRAELGAIDGADSVLLGRRHPHRWREVRAQQLHRCRCGSLQCDGGRLQQPLQFI